jgi:lysine-N-methylase
LPDQKIAAGKSFCGGFSCAAGACPFTCCMQWIISVDPETLRKWEEIPVSSLTAACGENSFSPQAVPDQYGTADGRAERPPASLAEIGTVPDPQSGNSRIRPGGNGECPFLLKSRLCGVQTAFGAGCIPRTCRIFPRIVYDYPERTEFSLSACCPEVLKTLSGMETGFPGLLSDFETPEVPDFLWQVRRQILLVIADETVPTGLALLTAAYILLDIRDRAVKETGYGAANAVPGAAGEWFGRYENPAFLAELRNAAAGAAPDPEESLQENLELFLDLTKNYSEAGMYADELEPVRKKAERLADSRDRRREYINNNVTKGGPRRRGTGTEVPASESRLLRGLVLAECVSQLASPDTDLRDLMLTFEWIVMEFSLGRLLLILWDNAAGEKAGPEETIILLTAAARVMGFSEDDIEEYMESAFSEPVWEWGYYDLLIG